MGVLLERLDVEVAAATTYALQCLEDGGRVVIHVGRLIPLLLVGGRVTGNGLLLNESFLEPLDSFSDTIHNDSMPESVVENWANGNSVHRIIAVCSCLRGYSRMDELNMGFR